MFLVLLVACADKPRELTSANLGNIDYAVPEGWAMRDVSQNGQTILVWTPTDNDRKQSVTVIRTQPMPHLAKASKEYLASKLGQTLKQPGRSLVTKRGLDAVRADGRFTPRGMASSYMRSHAVFFDGDALVHIIYTAKEPDREVFELVLDHVARKAG
jgi:hypothetical protein